VNVDINHLVPLLDFEIFQQGQGHHPCVVKDDINAIEFIFSKLDDRILNPLLLATNYADKDRAELIVKASNVEWLIVRPGFLTNGPRTGKYRGIENLSGVTAGKISRADVADFILKQLASPTYFGKTPLLMY
jgi:NAD(P)H-binding